jgi:organic hydroperoxide reductase OsmC/OhrA
MAEYTAEIRWQRGTQPFLDKRYSRRHTIRFDGGLEIPGSSSPHVVPLPYSDAAAVDPEEALVAALSSCHMLWFLSLAAERGYRIDTYVDRAAGAMTRDARGKFWMSRVTLRPVVRFDAAAAPSAGEFASMHEIAHDECFIANSVKTAVHCEPTLELSSPP